MRSCKKLFSARRVVAFTLIEILVTVTIIVLLSTILLAVGSSVHKNSQISATRAELKALEGLAEQFQREMNQPLPPTMYDTNGMGAVSPNAGSPPNLASPAPQWTFADILYRYPPVKEQLIKMAGNKLKADANGHWAVLDYFGNPISFLPQNCSSTNVPISFPYSVPAVNNWNPITKDYFRSSGSDGVTVWGNGNENDLHNNDDIFSYEAAR